MWLKENEIRCPAHAVKYHDIDYSDSYVTITQHRTHRRVPVGYYFEDTGTHIYVSPFYSHLFQHKKKVRLFILNKETKEWRETPPIEITKHIPEPKQPVTENIINELKR